MILVLLVGPEPDQPGPALQRVAALFLAAVAADRLLSGQARRDRRFLGLVLVVPSLIAYVLGLLFSLDITIIGDTWRCCSRASAYGLVMSLSAGTLILALSSLSRNSRYVGLFWLGRLVVSSIVGSILDGVDSPSNGAADTIARSRRPRRRNASTAQDSPTTRCASGRRSTQASTMRAWADFGRDEIEAAEDRLAAAGLVYRRISPASATELAAAPTPCSTSSAKMLPREARDRSCSTTVGPQYPWYWSAASWLLLFGISACILNFRVKSLDRLK